MGGLSRGKKLQCIREMKEGQKFRVLLLLPGLIFERRTRVDRKIAARDDKDGLGDIRALRARDENIIT